MRHPITSEQPLILSQLGGQDQPQLDTRSNTNAAWALAYNDLLGGTAKLEALYAGTSKDFLDWLPGEVIS